jgi:hypothetical protein
VSNQPVLDRQARHTRKVPDIARYNDEGMRQSNRGDSQICLSERGALLFQRSAQLPVVPRGINVERHYLQVRDKLPLDAMPE